MRSIKWALALAAAAITVLTFNAASAQGTLRIGMTASDIPLTTGQTDQGGEGMRFMGYTVYDGLINWDLSSFDKPSDLVPGLATSYGVDPADASKNKWIFKIREGVKFHDGSRVHRRHRSLELRQAAQERQPAIRPAPVSPGSFAHSIGRVLQGGRQIYAGDRHQIAGRVPALPARLDHDVVTGAVGEARQELGSIRQDAVGHRARGSSRCSRHANAPKWFPTRSIGTRPAIPKLDKLVLLPLPEANARVAALRAGQVDWIEAPAARRGRIAEVGRLQDRHQCLSPQLDVASLARRRLALERHPGTQGRQSRDRPRRHEGASRRPDDSGGGLHAARPSMVRQADLQAQI